MASPDAVVRDLVHRLSAQPEAARRILGHERASTMEELREVLQTATDMHNLFDAVQGVKHLFLARSSIGDKGIRVLMRAFTEGSKRESTLLHLDLSDNGITEQGFEALADGLESGSLPNLQHLILSQNRIGAEGINMLAKILRTGQHSSLQGLDLSRCSIGDDGMVSFADSLQSGNFSALDLQSLDLSANSFGENGTRSLTRAFVMGRLPKLKFLNLSHNNVGEGGTQALSDILNGGLLSGLTHLLLSRCALTDALPIARAMERGNLTSIQALDLSGNQMGDQGGVALAIALRTGRVPKLQHLNLSQCGIGGHQIDFITKAIASGQVWGLRHLDLSRNPMDNLGSFPSTYSMINDQGSLALARLIKAGHLDELEYLDLSKCSITDEGLIALAEGMTSGKLRKLQEFLFEGNEVTEKRSIKALVMVLESGELPHLHKLELGHNSAGEDVTMALASALTVSSAQGALVLSLKERLSRSQKNQSGGTVGRYLSKVWRNRSFRGLESIKLDETELKPAERIFNKFLEHQYSPRLTPVVDDEIARPTTSKFFFNAFIVLSWVLALLVSKRLSW